MKIEFGELLVKTFLACSTITVICVTSAGIAILFKHIVVILCH